jgi:phospholipid/cholesterol/gamma-HCH transport system substrate-binding protein
MKRTKRGHVATVVAGVAFVAAMLVGLMFFAGLWRLGSGYDVNVVVPNARGLAPDAHVTIAGLEVGKVTSIDRQGPNARLTLRIDAGPTPLPADSRVEVRLRTLAGESYVEVYPGHMKATIPSGGSLGISQANDYVDVDQILQTLSGSTQTRARQLVQALGSGVGNRGQDLNQVLGNASALITNSVPLTSTLAAQHNQVADLVQNLGNMMSAIGQQTTAVETFATGARQTFSAIAARDAALHQTLVKLPYLIGSLKQISGQLVSVTPHVAPLATNLASALDELSPTIHLLAPAASSGVQLLHSLSGAAYPLRDVLQNLDKLQRPTRAALPQLHATLCQLNPILKYAAPYGPDLAAFFENFGSASNPYSGTYHITRALANIGPADAPGLLTESEAQAAQALFKIGFGNTLASGYDPIPPPHQMNQTTIGRGAYGPVPAGKLIHYPRIYAGDC